MTDQSRCFIAMPITTRKEQSEAYGDTQHWRHVMDHLFVPAIEKAGFEPKLPMSTGTEMIHAEIVKNLETCDLVLVDLSSLNPNVFFELGVRDGARQAGGAGCRRDGEPAAV